MSNEKLFVKINFNSPDNDYKPGEIGFIHGYVRGKNDSPYVVVVIKDRIVLVPTYGVTVLTVLED